MARYPNEMAPRRINREIVSTLGGLGENDFRGNLIILEPGRIRIKRIALTSVLWFLLITHYASFFTARGPELVEGVKPFGFWFLRF
jgi:hypothetical protein